MRRLTGRDVDDARVVLFVVVDRGFVAVAIDPLREVVEGPAGLAVVDPELQQRRDGESELPFEGQDLAVDLVDPGEHRVEDRLAHRPGHHRLASSDISESIVLDHAGRTVFGGRLVELYVKSAGHGV